LLSWISACFFSTRSVCRTSRKIPYFVTGFHFHPKKTGIRAHFPAFCGRRLLFSHPSSFVRQQMSVVPRYRRGFVNLFVLDVRDVVSCSPPFLSPPPPASNLFFSMANRLFLCFFPFGAFFCTPVNFPCPRFRVVVSDLTTLFFFLLRSFFFSAPPVFPPCLRTPRLAPLFVLFPLRLYEAVRGRFSLRGTFPSPCFVVLPIAVPFDVFFHLPFSFTPIFCSTCFFGLPTFFWPEPPIRFFRPDSFFTHFIFSPFFFPKIWILFPFFFPSPPPLTFRHLPPSLDFLIPCLVSSFFSPTPQGVSSPQHCLPSLSPPFLFPTLSVYRQPPLPFFSVAPPWTGLPGRQRSAAANGSYVGPSLLKSFSHLLLFVFCSGGCGGPRGLNFSSEPNDLHLSSCLPVVHSFFFFSSLRAFFFKGPCFFFLSHLPGVFALPVTL